MKQDRKAKRDEISNGITGLVMLAAIGWAVWTFALKGDDADAAIKADDPSLTLEGYAALSQTARDTRIASAVAAVDAPEADISAFTRCMGDMTRAKAGDLLFDEVFSWCDSERQNNREAFEDHFDELSARDLSLAAVSICKDLVRDQMVAPGSAKFPRFDYQAHSLKRQRYVVKSYVDSQNVFGATLRSNYHCDVQHDGQGERLDAASWTVHELEVL